MAENKKSFLLYCDIIHTIKKLNNEQTGVLFKHILSYVNDENPILEDLLLEVVFEPIKQNLKRDLSKWENICDRNKNNGAKGGRPKNPKEPKKPTGLKKNPKNPTEPDNDNDNESDNESDNENNNKFIIPNLNDVILYFKENNYNQKLAEMFYQYYTDLKWINKNNKPIRSWKTTAQQVWFTENSVNSMINKPTKLSM